MQRRKAAFALLSRRGRKRGGRRSKRGEGRSKQTFLSLLTAATPPPPPIRPTPITVWVGLAVLCIFEFGRAARMLKGIHHGYEMEKFGYNVDGLFWDPMQKDFQESKQNCVIVNCVFSPVAFMCSLQVDVFSRRYVLCTMHTLRIF